MNDLQSPARSTLAQSYSSVSSGEPQGTSLPAFQIPPQKKHLNRKRFFIAGIAFTLLFLSLACAGLFFIGYAITSGTVGTAFPTVSSEDVAGRYLIAGVNGESLLILHADGTYTYYLNASILEDYVSGHFNVGAMNISAGTDPDDGTFFEGGRIKYIMLSTDEGYLNDTRTSNPSSDSDKFTPFLTLRLFVQKSGEIDLESATFHRELMTIEPLGE